MDNRLTLSVRTGRTGSVRFGRVTRPRTRPFRTGFQRTSEPVHRKVATELTARAAGLRSRQHERDRRLVDGRLARGSASRADRSDPSQGYSPTRRRATLMYNSLNLGYFTIAEFRLSEGLVHKRSVLDAPVETFAATFATLGTRTAYHCSASLLHIESRTKFPGRNRSRELGFDTMAASRSGGRRRRTGPLRCHARSVIPSRIPDGLLDVAPQPSGEARTSSRVAQHRWRHDTSAKCPES